MNNTESDFAIYQTSTGAIELREDANAETIWATQAQIAEIFGTGRTAITKQIINIFEDKELDEISVCAKMAHTGSDGKSYQVFHYNLDAIIAVGYRVNSKKATAFRQWATKTLRQYLEQGYILNESRLAHLENGMRDAHRAIELAKSTIGNNMNDDMNQDITKEVLNILERYTRTFTLLESFDKQNVQSTVGTKNTIKITFEECQSAISKMKTDLMSRDEASELFGMQREHGLEQVIGSIYQTFGGDDLYPSIEDKAAHVLYLTIKDHPFSDGNKRIGSFLFVYFLNKSEYLFRENGENKINDNALVALALLVAESNPKDKDLLINLIKQLITN